MIIKKTGIRTENSFIVQILILDKDSAVDNSSLWYWIFQRTRQWERKSIIIKKKMDRRSLDKIKKKT